MTMDLRAETRRDGATASVVAASGAAPIFSAFLAGARTVRAGRRGRASLIAASLLIHAAGLSAALAWPRRAPERVALAVPVNLAVDPTWFHRSPSPTPASASPAPPAVRTWASRPRGVAPHPEARPLEQPSAAADPAAPETPEPVIATAAAEEAGGQVDARAASGATTIAGSTMLAAFVSPPPEAERRRDVAAYGARLRPHLATFFRYPADAEADGVEGRVILRLTIDAAGRLRAVETLGACPHPVLCAAAENTARAAAPFPPPPAHLGDLVRVEVPFVYRLE